MPFFTILMQRAVITAVTTAVTVVVIKIMKGKCQQ
jgi:hypothetical protein